MQSFMTMPLLYLQNPFSCFTYLPLTPPIAEFTNSNSDQQLYSHSSFGFNSYPDTFSSACPTPTENQELKLEHRESKEIPNVSSLEKIQTKESLDNIKNVTNSRYDILAEEEEALGLKKEQENGGYIFKRQKSRKRGVPKKVKKNKEDQDYNPDLDRMRKTFQKYQVNQNRNVIPNEINQVFSFVQKDTKSQYLLFQLFQKYPHPQNYTIQRFYQYQNLLKTRLGHYTNEKSLKFATELYEPKCESYTEEQQWFYNKICRILIHKFLNEASLYYILTSKRMKKEKKIDHLRARRQIAHSLGCILRGL